MHFPRSGFSSRVTYFLLLSAVVLVVTASGFILSACQNLGSQELQGVTVSDNGSVAVTFRVPDGMTVEDVLGCEIGQENTSAISGLGSSSATGLMYWCEVATGGILTRYGDNEDVYRYGPTAETTSATGVTAPPAYVMMTEYPEENEILKQEDAGELAERYGINLYFDGNAPNSNAKASGEVYSAADFQFTEVSRFSPGFSDGVMRVTAISKTGARTDSSWFILGTDGTMVQAPCFNFSNFFDGTALAAVGMNNNDYADSIIDKQGNVIWSIAEEGEASAGQYFAEGEVAGISSAFNVKYDTSGDIGDTYYGYFPIEFSVDSFDATGTCLGILDGQGEWVVEPTKQIGYLRETGPCIAFEYGDRSDDSYGIVFSCIDGNVYECADEDEFSERRREINLSDYLSEHNELVYSKSDYLPDDIHPETDGFYDVSGELAVDLSSYNLRSYPEFVDGYALLEIMNDQNSNYLTIVDTSGKQTFSPIKDTGHGQLSEGKVFIENGEDGYFIDVQGNKIGSLTGDSSVPFSEDYAWIKTNEGWKCIDESGAVQYE